MADARARQHDEAAEAFVLGPEALAFRRVALTLSNAASKQLYDSLLPNFGPDGPEGVELSIERRPEAGQAEVDETKGDGSGDEREEL